MSVEANKNIANEFFIRFNANDIHGVLDLMPEDVIYWVAGDPDRLSAAGTHNKERIAQIFASMSAALKNGLSLTVKSLIAEGDKVAIEAESHGELKNGRIYNNSYFFYMTIREGKISHVKEYMDTHHVYTTWYQDNE